MTAKIYGPAGCRHTGDVRCPWSRLASFLAANLLLSTQGLNTSFASRADRCPVLAGLACQRWETTQPGRLEKLLVSCLSLASQAKPGPRSTDDPESKGERQASCDFLPWRRLADGGVGPRLIVLLPAVAVAAKVLLQTQSPGWRLSHACTHHHARGLLAGVQSRGRITTAKALPEMVLSSPSRSWTPVV